MNHHAHAGLWSNTNSLLGVSITHASASNPQQHTRTSQACSLHACTISTGAVAGSCKLQHVAQLQLQQGAIILEPKQLLQALLLDDVSHAASLSNTTDTTTNQSHATTTAAVANAQPKSKRHTPKGAAAAAISNKSRAGNATGTAAKPTKPDGSASTGSAAVDVHLAACCEPSHSSSDSTTSSSSCLQEPSPAAAAAVPVHVKAQGHAENALQETLQDNQQQPQQHGEQPVWSNTVKVTLSEQQKGNQHTAAAGCAPAAKHWDVATPLLLQPAASNGQDSGSAPAAHAPAGEAAATAAATGELVSGVGMAEIDLQDSSSSNQQLLLIKLLLPAINSSAAARGSGESTTHAAAGASQQASQEAAASSSLQLWMGRATMLLLVVAVQLAVYRFATT
jgi:hypothetical protein